MKHRYFGTDGIRGRVGEPPMTPEFALKLGWAVGRVLAHGSGARVLIGKDTRRSGYLFESALEAGLAAAGVESYLLGPLPTPAVAYLTRALRAQAGIVISASHNPHFDNGVKFFSADGDKLDDALEARIEEQIDMPLSCVTPERMGRARRIEDAPGRYIEFCKSAFKGRSLKGLRIALDCANGAAYRVAPAVLSELGAEVLATGDRPDGLNINRNCGSTHLAHLQKLVREQSADVGIALDGDGDRCLMVSADGAAVDGDQILYIIALERLRAGRLVGPVVGTEMSNLGLEHALRAMDVRFERARVGDRNVLEKLRAVGGTVGGETSGHTLCLDRATTGDGIVTGLLVLDAMLASSRSLSELASGMRKFPQVLINVRLDAAGTETSGAANIMQHPAVVSAQRAIEQQLGARGRTLLRLSGTEPLARIMVEADDETLALNAASQLADSVRGALQSTPQLVESH